MNNNANSTKEALEALQEGLDKALETLKTGLDKALEAFQESPADKALRELDEGLAWARADLDPQWYGMGDSAMRAMAEYPPWLERKAAMDEDDIELHGDSIRLELAGTPEFRAFLVSKFPGA